MLIAILLAAAEVQAAAPPPPPESPPAWPRRVIEQQLRNRASQGPHPLPPQTGAEASAMQANYLKSIGRQLTPADDSLAGGNAGSSNGGSGSGR